MLAPASQSTSQVRVGRGRATIQGSSSFETTPIPRLVSSSAAMFGKRKAVLWGTGSGPCT
jgi:hypothetical protein